MEKSQDCFEKFFHGRNLIETISKENPDHLCMFCAGALGDIVISASLSDELQNRFEKSQTCLIIPEKYSSVGKMYENVSKLIPMSAEDFKSIGYFVNKSDIRQGENWFFGGLILVHGLPILFRNQNLTDSYKTTFELPQDSKQGKFVMELPDMDFLIRKYKINPDRAVILFPSSKSITISACTAEFWSSLVKILNEMDFEIYTNCAENELPIDGTIKLDVNLQEIFCLSEKVRYCIGIRSGVFDLLSRAFCRIICLSYDFGSDNFVADLESNFPRLGIETVYCNNSMHADDILKRIVDVIQKGFC